MTQEEIEQIKIGTPFMWNLDGQQTTRADTLANAFHVSGLTHAEADLTQTAGGDDEWQYRLRQKGKAAIVSEDSYRTKELALEGLKRRLLTE